MAKSHIKESKWAKWPKVIFGWCASIRIQIALLHCNSRTPYQSWRISLVNAIEVTEFWANFIPFMKSNFLGICVTLPQKFPEFFFNNDMKIFIFKWVLIFYLINKISISDFFFFKKKGEI